jgi:hypothetical protein
MCIFQNNCLVAQTNQNYIFSIKSGPGKVLNAYSEMSNVNLSSFTSIEYAYFGNTHSWQQYLNFPEYGLEFMLGNLNNDFLGNVAGIQPFMRWYLTDRLKPIQLSFTGGLGLSYFSNKYNPWENPENGLIGSSLTNYTRVEFELGYKYKHVRLFGTFGIFHFSNGHVKLPNMGANFLQSKIGITYYSDDNFDFQKNEKNISRKWKYSLRTAVGAHSYGSTIKPYGGPVSPVYTLSQSFGKLVSPAYRISFGINIGHYSSFYNFMQNEVKNEEHPFLKSTYGTIFFGQEMCMGHVALYGEFGIDFYKQFLREYGNIFNNENSTSSFIKKFNSNRLGLKYYFRDTDSDDNNFSLGIFIKANLFQADFAECAIEYRF